MGGAALAAGSEPGSAWRGFGVQSAGWGAVNVGIAAWGLLRASPEPASTVAEALEDEDGWSHILLLNLGLNVGYAAVGTALVVVADHGVESGPEVRGHGASLIVQGLGLLALDGVAWAASRGRLARIRGWVPGGVEPGPAPGAASFTLLSLPLG